MKRQLDQLALFGGPVEFDQPLHVGRPFVGNRNKLLSELERILDRRQLTNGGPLVHHFERVLSEILEVENVIPLANGTLGLIVLLKALDLQGEVLLPSYTYIATAHAVAWQGLKPVFCEIDPSTHNLDPEDLQARIGSETAAILPVHLWGRPCDVTAIDRIGRDHGVPVVYDAAHAFNVSVEGRKVGNFGEAEVFSFHATKFINCLEGGAVATQDDHLAAELKRLIDFGYGSNDEIEGLGINAKMNEFSAAMGLSTLADMAEIIAVNRDTHSAYLSELEGIAGLSLLEYDENASPNYQYVTVEVEETEFGLNRDEIVTLLQAEQVLARKYFDPGCHRTPPYRMNKISLPVTEAVSDKVFCLPSGADISPGVVSRVTDLLTFIQNLSPRIKDRLLYDPSSRLASR